MWVYSLHEFDTFGDVDFFVQCTIEPERMLLVLQHGLIPFLAAQYTSEEWLYRVDYLRGFLLRFEYTDAYKAYIINLKYKIAGIEDRDITFQIILGVRSF